MEQRYYWALMDDGGSGVPVMDVPLASMPVPAVPAAAMDAESQSDSSVW
jgi:hypothetical protein